MSPLRTLRDRLGRFFRHEDGSATIEFAIVVPGFLYLFLSTFEMGMVLTRDAMLGRGLDMTIREVRLGRFDTVNPTAMHDELKESICDYAAILPDCLNQLKLEMQPVDPRAWSTLDSEADCIDRSDPSSRPATNFVPGVANQLMLLRACFLVDPFFPQLGLGKVARDGQGYFSLMSMSAFVIEPT